MEDYKKKYEQALKRAIKWASQPTVWSSDDICQKIFPELKESWDDVMRKMAIKAVYAPEAQSCIKSWGVEPKDVITWLEKKPVEWSAYDKATLEYIIEDIKELCDNETEEGSIETYNRELNLLQAINNSIKLSSYTNPAAWSEEDDDNIMLIEDRLSDYLDYIRGDFTLTKHQKNSLKERVIGYVNWLKSLKERMKGE